MEIKRAEIIEKLDLVIDKLMNLEGPENEHDKRMNVYLKQPLIWSFKKL